MTRIEELRAALAKATKGPFMTRDMGPERSFDARFAIEGPKHPVSSAQPYTSWAQLAWSFTEANAHAITAAMNSLSALLDVAEAAQLFLPSYKIHDEQQKEGPCQCSHHQLMRALAKLSDGMVPNVHGGEK